MFDSSKCDCPVCRLEKSLAAELGEPGANAACAALLGSHAVFSCFGSWRDLVRELHEPEYGRRGARADHLVTELVRQNTLAGRHPVLQRLLLLVFIPAIHRTASQIAASFSALARDDVSQHVISEFLEVLGSRELAACTSHVAFTIVRKMRRLAFRWAIREARGAAAEDSEARLLAPAAEPNADEPLYQTILLGRFLDNCEKMGWLSAEERALLVAFKIEGARWQELARRKGYSEVAVRHRMQRVIERLRRVAQEKQWRRAPEQLELFPE